MDIHEPIQTENILKWSFIVICGVIFFAFSGLVLRLLSDIPYLLDISGYEGKMFNDLIVLLSLPIMFIVTIGYFYASNMNLILWVTWEIAWGYFLYLTYRNRMVWSLKSQIISHVILASSALIPFILWVVLVTPEIPGIPSYDDMQIIDPFYSIQVCWIIPLWFMIWCYGWLIEVPQDLVIQRKMNFIQLIWFCLFIIVNFYVILYLGDYFWWIPYTVF